MPEKLNSGVFELFMNVMNRFDKETANEINS